jgi:hypothetical protein
VNGRVAPGGSQNITNPTFKTDIAYAELVARARNQAVVQLAAVFAADWIGEAASSLWSIPATL